MQLTKVSYKNLFSIGKVELELNARGLVLVTGYSEDEKGANGSGKSGISSKGIVWTFYGKTVGGLRGDSVINRHGGKKAYGQIEFIGIDDKNYTIKRERPAKLTLIRGSTDISAHNSVDTQKLIDQVIGMDYTTFTQTTCFGQGRKMSYAGLTPKEQKALLEQILPLGEVDKWAKYADARAKEIDKTVDARRENCIRSSTKVEGLETQLRKVKDNAITFEAYRKNRVAEIERRRKDAEARIVSKKETLVSINAELAQEDRAKLKRSKESYEHEQGLLAELKETYNSHVIHAIHSKEQWNARLITLGVETQTLENSKTCPTCLRSFDDTTVEGVKRRLEANASLISEASENLNLATSAESFYLNSKVSTVDEYNTLADKIRAITTKLERLSALLPRKIELEHEIKENFKTIDSELDAAKGEENPHNAYVLSCEGEIEVAEKEQLADIDLLWAASSEHEHLIYWRDVYAKDLKLKLFEQCCGYLDTQCASHLAGLQNPQFHVKFSTVKRLASGETKDEFEVAVSSDSGGDGFDSLSGGEQQMVSFAIGLALADLAACRAEGQPEFLILDEPFAELDSRNSEAIVEYLTSLDKDTIMLISNEESLKGLIPNRIEVIKIHGITSVKSS